MRHHMKFALVILLLAANLAPAQAETVAFGGGSWRPAYALRQLFDCFYNQAQGGGNQNRNGFPSKPGPWAKASNCPAFNSSGAGGEILYVSHVESNYKQMLRTNSFNIDDPTLSYYSCDLQCAVAFGNSAVTFSDVRLGIGASGYSGFDGFQFIATEAPVDPAELTAWTVAGNGSAYGSLVQLPIGAAPIALLFGGTDGNNRPLNILQPVPPGGSSGLNLSRNALCGIFSGHITRWDNPILTAINGGVLGGGPIAVVVADGGMNYLLTSALAAQCQFEIGPNNENDATLVSYAFPWTDRSAACPNPPARGSLKTNWPNINRYAASGPDQCGRAIAVPANAKFVRTRQTGSEVTYLAYPEWSPGDNYQGIPGSIAAVPMRYITTSVVGVTLRAINIESEWVLATGSGRFQPPTWQGAQIAMAQAVPQFDDTTRLNPLAWSLAGQVPDPVLPGAYPISGFTWIEMYQCYASHANGNNPFLWLRSWIDYLYGSDQAEAILRENGFVGMSPAWKEEIYKLLNDPANGPAQHGNGGCTSVAGAY
ncbi:hypothetical protein; putative signal peptide [Bradyrhizobium sp. ORS 278]|nr:hypothetical protein; putative signal peptide [Bradyrhizobium sp. ORS 278]